MAGCEVLDRPEILYWRTAAGHDVDFVLERRGEVIGVEVTATRRLRLADIRHLRVMQEEYGEGVRECLLLHTGERVERLAPDIWRRRGGG